jgi:hypothetical protein
LFEHDCCMQGEIPPEKPKTIQEQAQALLPKILAEAQAAGGFAVSLAQLSMMMTLHRCRWPHWTDKIFIHPGVGPCLPPLVLGAGGSLKRLFLV